MNKYKITVSFKFKDVRFPFVDIKKLPPDTMITLCEDAAEVLRDIISHRIIDFPMIEAAEEAYTVFQDTATFTVHMETIDPFAEDILISLMSRACNRILINTDYYIVWTELGNIKIECVEQ